MKRRIAAAWLAGACWLAATGLHAQDFRITPAPLAEKARLKPEPDAFERLDAGLRKSRTRYSVLIGAHDWDALEKEYQALEAAYRRKAIDGDEFAHALIWFAPDNGQIQLADLEQWVKDRPKSYIAWFTLGMQYLNTAWDERGNASASQTSREQFAAMEKFATKAHAALRTSIPLAPKPVASYAEIIGAAELIPRRRPGAVRQTAALRPTRGQVHCPSGASSSGEFATDYEEQLHFACLAYATDPEMSIAMRRFMFFQVPAWGGRFEETESLLAELEAGRRMPAKTLVSLRARLLADRGYSLSDRNPKAAVQYLLDAFDRDPRVRNAPWLRHAAETARWEAKDLRLAVASLDKLIALVPDDVEALASRGWAYEGMGDHRRYMEGMIAAAMLGKKEAQNNVGYYYMVGQRGLPRDLKQAHAWLTLAANQGFQHSRDKLPMVEEMMRKEAQK